ncbi:hypothetical protein GCM10009736_06840 [Actinomadura bangladeshensis]
MLMAATLRRQGPGRGMTYRMNVRFALFIASPFARWSVPFALKGGARWAMMGAGHPTHESSP